MVVTAAGGAHSALAEVDLITGTSGGSFTALAYALYGERLFGMYEDAFLKRDVEGALLQRLFNPITWPQLLSQGFGRSELAADYYDEILFHGATYRELLKQSTPIAVVGATDVTTGVPMDRYSTASIATLQDMIREWKLRQRLEADARRLGQDANAGDELPAIEFTVVDVSFRTRRGSGASRISAESADVVRLARRGRRPSACQRRAGAARLASVPKACRRHDAAAMSATHARARRASFTKR